MEPKAARIPPQNNEAEASLLGAILIDADAIVKVADMISPADFYEERHQRIYEAMVQLYEKHSPIDVLTLANQLRATGLLDMAGGAAYLTELTNFVPTAAHAEQYAEIVRQKAIRRRLIKASQAIVALGYDEAKSLQELIEEAESELFRVSQSHVKQDITSIETVLSESFDRLDELHKDKSKIRGVPTGFKDLDDVLAGLQRSDLFILAARPSMGKAQPLDAKVLTPTGWKFMGELQVGDQLASTDGRPSHVLGVYPQGLKQVYRVTFSDGRTTECCGDHLWTVHYRSWTEPRVLTTDEIADKLSSQRYQGRLWIDVFDGNYGVDENLPVKPWVMGILLAEADLNNLRFPTANHNFLERMTADLAPNFSVNWAGNYDYRIVTDKTNSPTALITARQNQLRQALRRLELWGLASSEKFVPEIYKSASRQTRLELLRGLMDGDGWVEKHGKIHFASASIQLAYDVADLVRSLGGWAKVNRKTTGYTYRGKVKQGLDSYVVNIVPAAGDMLFTVPEKVERAQMVKLRRKKPVITSVEPSRQTAAQCIKVSHPSELYITDNFVVTHNTAFSLNLAHNVAVKAQQPVLIFSLEMSKEQLVDRMLSMESGVDAWALRTGNLTDNDFERIGHAMGTLSEAQIYIDDTPGITVSDLRTKARREAHQRPIGLIIVDYLQLMSGGARFGGEANRVQEVSEISRGLKGIARELNVPLVALSQLSRSVESRHPQIPQLADLRESGSIEQDADVVAFIYREDYYNPETERRNIADIFIRKHRNGPTGAVELYFDREKQRFRGLDAKHQQPFSNE